MMFDGWLVERSIQIGWRLLAAFLVLLALGDPASAEDSDDCGGASVGPRRIAACSRIIGERTASPERRASAYRNRAIAWSDSGHDERALADYDSAIALDPDNTDAINDRGLIWLNKGENERAISDFDRAIELDPAKAAAFYNRGLAKAHTGDDAHSVADYSRAIELDPAYVAAFNNRGFVFNRMGEFDRAIADFDEAISLYPQHPFAYNNRAISWGAKGEGERAIADYSQAITLDPTYVNPYGSRGIYYFYDNDDPTKAQADFTAAVELAPHNAYYAIWLALALRRDAGIGHLRQSTERLDMTSWPAPLVRMFLGDQTPEEALAAANNSIPTTKRRNLCEANLYIAEFHWLRGDTDKALPFYRFAARDCPRDFIEYVAANRRLHALGVSP